MGQNAEELNTTNTTTTGAVTDHGVSGTGSVSGTSTTPADIEATRASLSRDIDELTDKVSPARVMDRRKEAAKGRIGSIKDKVMGAAPDLDSVKDRVPGVGSSSGSSGPGVGDRVSGVASNVSGIGKPHTVRMPP